jgi:hypothetical protein
LAKHGLKSWSSSSKPGLPEDKYLSTEGIISMGFLWEFQDPKTKLLYLLMLPFVWPKKLWGSLKFRHCEAFYMVGTSKKKKLKWP